MTQFSGVDVVLSRSFFRAVSPGPVPNAERTLGCRVEVFPRSCPLLVPLKRLGLQHDRFTQLTLREGDELLMYVSSGGKG
jgi:hypothetical protein